MELQNRFIINSSVINFLMLITCHSLFKQSTINPILQITSSKWILIFMAQNNSDNENYFLMDWLALEDIVSLPYWSCGMHYFKIFIFLNKI